MKRNGIVTALPKSNEEMKYMDIENNYNGLYKIFINHRFSSYKTFISEIIKYYNRYVSIYDIKQKISYIASNISFIKAKKMDLILNYQVAQRDKNERECFILRRQIKHNIGGEYKESLEKKDLKFQLSVLSDLSIVLKNEESIEELYKQGKIKNDKILSDIEYFLKGLSKDKYIKLLMKHYNLKPINEEELNQYIEVIKYFCVNIERKISLLKSYNTEEDEEQIRKFVIDGEEKLSNRTTDNINALYNWKIKKLYSKLKIYKKLLNVYEKLSNDFNMDSFTRLEHEIRKDIEKDEPFIEEYYSQIIEMDKVYLDISRKKVISEETKKEIQEEFNNQLLLRNNK